MSTQRNPGPTCACCQQTPQQTTNTLRTLCSTKKKLVSFAEISIQAPAHHCRLRRMVTKPDQGSFQYRTSHSSKYSDKKNKVCFNTSTKISQRLQVTAPRPLKVEDTPAIPRSYTPTLQVVHPSAFHNLLPPPPHCPMVDLTLSSHSSLQAPAGQ